MELQTTRNIDLAKPTIGEVANQVAAKHAFTDYRDRKAANTITRQDNDLKLFADYLAEMGAAVNCYEFGTNPDCWIGVTWGLVEGFVRWQLQTGFAVSSANVRLSTIKTYAKLAVKAETLDITEFAMISLVNGYSQKEGKHIDKARQKADIPTRIDRPGAKKAQSVVISRKQANRLKNQNDTTEQGRRDGLLMALLLDHGLRAGEVARLTVANFNLADGTFSFYRPKVDNETTHKMTRTTRRFAEVYFENDALAVGPLLRGSRKGGRLTGAGMSERAITKRAKTLGLTVGLDGLSSHDCRHYAATYHAKTKDVKELMDIFGWNSPAMAVRYIDSAKVIELE